MKTRRERLEIMKDILTIVRTRRGKIRKTKLMVVSNLSFDMINFYLLKLKENMNTETAKKMADERHKFMELFLQEFFDEWEGKK